MENKYYTPDISEFRIGFEYEYRTNVDEWFKHEITLSGDLVDSLEYAESNLVRVKYLDKQDIGECGFKTEIKSDMCYAQFGDKDLYLDYNFLTYECKIHNIDEILFLGKINNKSELKQILKMIGVE